MNDKLPTIQFQQLGQDAYKRIIASPSQSQAYFDRFHKPVIETARSRFGRTTNVLSIACGYGHELVFFKKYKRIRAFGIDINSNMLDEARGNNPNAVFVTWDVRDRKSRFMHGKFQMSIAINALIYCPYDMAAFMHKALAPGAFGVVNLRIGNEPLNAPFFKDCIKMGCKDDKEEVKAGKYTFTLRAMDYTARTDSLQRLGRQLYFRTERDAQDFFAICGFEIYSQKVYQYPSEENLKNTVQVFTLQKPDKY